MVLNFCRYKTFLVFKSDTFENNTICVNLKIVTFEIFTKCPESVGFDANADFQEDLIIFKSDTFENYKSFEPVEVQNHNLKKLQSPLKF